MDASDRESARLAFRADPEAVYRFVGQFFEALVDSGVQHVCLSPGSRSTPLCVSAQKTVGLRTWVGLDERATSFFALGLAKTTGQPVALVCTSGTAAANYLPAVVEAHYSRVPLLLLTADRPPELRDWGAGQTIEQVGLFGGYVRWAVDVPLAGRGTDAIRYATQLAARAAHRSCGDPAGAVHLNWPFREPLPPPVGFFAREGPGGAQGEARKESLVQTPIQGRAEQRASAVEIDALVELVEHCERGVICVGPSSARAHAGGGERTSDRSLASAIAGFARLAGWPILADPASGLRGDPRCGSAPLITTGDGLLRVAEFSQRLRPDVVIRLGETPVSKSQRLWIEAAEPDAVWWLDEGSQWGEPSHRATRIVRGGAASLLVAASKRLAEAEEEKTPSRRDSAWCRAFESAERAARSAVAAFVDRGDAFSGASVAASVARCYAEEGLLFASNSMAIRLLDLVAGPSSGLRILCNRGASGIDGINSTALGVAAAGRAPTVLLTGDLAFLHDLSGLLLTKQESIDLVIVVIDDDGGGIFSFLPIAAQGEDVSFERLFGTPHGLDLARVAALFDFHYAEVSDPAALDEALESGRARSGVSLIHARLDRRENEARYRRLLSEIEAAVAGTRPI